MVRAVAERALERQGYRVLTATNGEEALELLENLGGQDEAIDLLISDVVMPTMDGPTLVRHARERFPDLPILFMSGYAEEALVGRPAFAGTALIEKPFAVDVLARRVRESLES